MIIIILLISFYLEGVVSNILNISFLIPSFTVISLMIIYPYLYNLKKDYYKICFIIGLLYDIAYTDTIFLNAFIFLLIGFIISKVNNIVTNNIFNMIPLSILVIILYRTITYTILLFTNYSILSINDLFNSIINSLLLNIIYGILLYKIADIIGKRKGIYKMN